MADLADMIQKLAFYQAGGKDPGTDTLDKVNAGAGIVDSTIKDVLAIKKQKLEGRKTVADTNKAERDVKTQTTPLGDLTPEEFNKMGSGYAHLAGKKTGVHRIIDKVTGKVLAEYPSSEGTGDTIHMIGEETLPTYKKSELLAMSPEDRMLLGKYKMVDDTAPNKNEDDNQTVDSILAGIDRLGNIRTSMNGIERGATVVPGGTAAGKMVSGNISSWETEKNLLAQRLGKLVEKNRMSDEDRNFYLRQFSSPAATDAAFGANSAALRNALAGMKKNMPGAGGPGAGSSGGAWDQSKEQRYQELLKKKQSGGLR